MDIALAETRGRPDLEVRAAHLASVRNEDAGARHLEPIEPVEPRGAQAGEHGAAACSEEVRPEPLALRRRPGLGENHPEMDGLPSPGPDAPTDRRLADMASGLVHGDDPVLALEQSAQCEGQRYERRHDHML
jgi:hypothetical protein